MKIWPNFPIDEITFKCIPFFFGYLLESCNDFLKLFQFFVIENSRNLFTFVL